MLDEVLEDGVTQREHLATHERQTGITPEALVPVDCPDEYKYLWSYFKEIGLRRTSNGFGPNPVQQAEILAWEQRRGIKLLRFENRALDCLEMLYLKTVRARK